MNETTFIGGAGYMLPNPDGSWKAAITSYEENSEINHVSWWETILADELILAFKRKRRNHTVQLAFSPTTDQGKSNSISSTL